ncbi:hypothetical protein EDD86DRAFT_208595 [Gorgonomyces haynaldii]|nr:hypothetical protein EDD86DRAFT_208595 [Gorgonomyces haynaldii]
MQEDLLKQLKERPKNPVAQEIATRTSENEPTLGFVSGPPGREHWKPDHKAPECTLCGQRFTLMLRRHHCRRCGDVFCAECSRFVTRLDQHGQFHPVGIPCRVCATCFHESTSDVQQPSPLTPPTIPIQQPPQPPLAETLMSVPNDWAWSTF